MEAQFYAANRTNAAELFPKNVWNQRSL
jgi:hypothetical protein